MGHPLYSLIFLLKAFPMLGSINSLLCTMLHLLNDWSKLRQGEGLYLMTLFFSALS